jgi:WD40 repeat protein
MNMKKLVLALCILLSSQTACELSPLTAPSAEVTIGGTQSLSSTLEMVRTPIKEATESEIPAITSTATQTGTLGTFSIIPGPVINKLNANRIKQLGIVKIDLGQQHSAYRHSLVWWPDGKILLVPESHFISVWDITTLKKSEEIEVKCEKAHCTQQDTISDLSINEFGSEVFIITQFYNGGIQKWNVQSKNIEQYTELSGMHSTFSISLSHNGKWIAIGSDGGVVIFNMELKEVTSLFSGDQFSRILSVEFSPDDKYLASYGDMVPVMIWRTSDWYKIKELDSNYGGALKFYGNGKLLAVGNSIFNTQTWNPIITLGMVACNLPTVAYGNGLDILILGDCKKDINIWDMDNGTLIASLTGHMDNVWSIAMSPDGRLIATIGMDNTLRIWGIPAQV